MIVPRFNLGRSGLSLLLEGEIDQRKHNHRSNDHDASGVPGLRRSALLLSGGAGQTEIPPPDWKAKDLGVGKIPKAPHGPMTTIWAPTD